MADIEKGIESHWIKDVVLMLYAPKATKTVRQNNPITFPAGAGILIFFLIKEAIVFIWSPKWMPTKIKATAADIE